MNETASNETASQERRIGILTVILVLLVVILFWMLYPHKFPFRTEGRGTNPGTDACVAGAKATLENIQPIPGDAPGAIGVLPLHQHGNVSVVFGSYSTKSSCVAVETHYKEEFPKHGFSYMGTKEASKGVAKSLSFSSSDYAANLSCRTAGASQSYLIIMQSKSHD